MQLVLVLPGLRELRGAGAAAARAPALAELLSVAGTPLRDEGGIAAALAARYGVVRQTDWPLAAIRLAVLGVDPGDAYWLAADPVTLEVGRDDVRLAGLVEDLARADADALVASLNAHFAGDGLTFVAPRPDAMFVRSGTRPRLSTQPLAAASGRSLRALLPEGPDAAAWRRWQSEIQMLFHEHPVNVERARLGRPPANSLWFSCGGTLPSPPAPAPAIRTYADAGIAIALALHARSPAHPVPARLADAVAAAAGADSIVVALPRPLDPAALERSWAAPARDALAAGRFASVSLLADDGGPALAWSAYRPGLWRRLTGRVRRRDLAALLAPASQDN